MNGSPASRQPTALPSFGTYQSKVNSSQLAHPPCSSCSECAPVAKKTLIFFKILATQQWQQCDLRKAFRLLQLNSPTEQQHIKVSLDASI